MRNVPPIGKLDVGRRPALRGPNAKPYASEWL